MKKFSSEIELRGHLIDSLILTKVFDGIMDHGGSFEVLDIQVGKKKKDESYAKLLVTGKNAKKSVSFEDIGVIVVDDDLTVDKEKEQEERRAFLEEARSQDSSE